MKLSEFKLYLLSVQVHECVSTTDSLETQVLKSVLTDIQIKGALEQNRLIPCIENCGIVVVCVYNVYTIIQIIVVLF